jgi:hypothetical protein
MRWLPTLHPWLARLEDGPARVVLAREVRRLHRVLGIRPAADEVRAQTRACVAAHRARRRAGAVPRQR